MLVLSTDKETMLGTQTSHLLLDVFILHTWSCLWYGSTYRKGGTFVGILRTVIAPKAFPHVFIYSFIH